MKKISMIIIIFSSLTCSSLSWSVSIDQLMKEGIALRDSGKVNEAILKFQEILKSKPKHAAANFELGLTLLRKADCNNAVIYLNNAVNYGYNQFKARLALGNAYQLCGNDQEAIIELQLALEIKPNSPEVHTSLGDVYIKKNGSIGLAESEYDKALGLDSTYVPAIVGLGNFYKYKRQADSAITLYEKAKIRNPRYAPVYFQLGLVYSEKKLYDKSILELSKYIELVPREPKGYSKLADIYEKNKDYDNAIKNIYTAITYGDTALNSLRFLSYLYNKAKRPNDNKEVLKRILERAPDDVNIWFELGKVYSLIDSVRGAIDAYNKALSMDSTRMPNLSFTLGLAYYQIETYDSAVIMFTRKIQNDTLAAGAYINRALCHLQLKKYGSARADLEKGVKLQPNHIQGHLWLAGVYFYLNLKAKAKAEYNAVLKLDPDNKDARAGLNSLAAQPPPRVENYDNYIDDEIYSADSL